MQRIFIYTLEDGTVYQSNEGPTNKQIFSNLRILLIEIIAGELQVSILENVGKSELPRFKELKRG